MRTISRLDNIQALRFIAALLVIFTHVTFYIRERIDPNVEVWHPGEIGVPIFFVISGFVMQLTSQSFETKIGGATQFMIRRISRICPLYWMITTFKVAIALVIPAAVLHNKPDLEHIVASYLFFPMFNAEGDVRPIHGVGWTLFHEMYFYSLFAIALSVRISPWKFCMASILPLTAIGYFLEVNNALYSVVTNPINLMFIAGILLSKLYQTGYKSSLLFACTSLGVSIILANNHWFVQVKNQYLGGIAYEAMLVVFGFLYIPGIPFEKIKNLLNLMGDSSYSLYLCHPIVAPALCVICFKFGINNIPVIVGVTIISTILISTLVHIIIENPANKLLKNKLSSLVGEK